MGGGIITESTLKYYYLDRLIDICNSDDIELVFVLSPTCSKKVQEEYSYFFDKYNGTALRVWNYLEDARFTRQDFFDFAHMNVHGAEKFSKIIAERINLR